MLRAPGHRRILLTAAVSLMAVDAGSAMGSERGWEARDRIEAFAQQGTFLSYVDADRDTAASRSFRVQYWRGPCMLYWSGEEGEGGMIPMGRFKSAEVDRQGRLQFLGQRAQNYLILSPHLSDSEREDIVERMKTIFEECHGPD
jgi:hypothetical protein